MRQAFDHSAPVMSTASPNPSWEYGNSTTNIFQTTASTTRSVHTEIDPFSPGRTKLQNYHLLMPAIPPPIPFISTLDKDGNPNLAPFSYFQLVRHDPVAFVVGFSSRQSGSKDTMLNLKDTGGCVINVVSEHMIEAVNATSLDISKGQSEWILSGFAKARSVTVKPNRVANAVFSAEEKLTRLIELRHGAGRAVIEGTRFWVRKDALKYEAIDLGALRPVVQLGGIAYGRVREVFELPRWNIEKELEETELKRFLAKKDER